MIEQLKYSFDDEPVTRFCYDKPKKKIELSFNGYFDVIKNDNVEGNVIFIIERWTEAKSLLGREEKWHDLDKHIGIFSMLLYMKYIDNEKLEILVSTIDDRCITILFHKPELSLVV